MNRKLEPGSRSQILQWINRTLNINQTRIENLGTGVVYCMLINHYYPGTLPLNRIVSHPRSPYDHKTNLKRFQQTLTALQIKTITFDVFRVSEMTYSQNWSLICKLYRELSNPKNNKPILAESRWQPKAENKVESTFMNKSINMGLSTPIKPPKEEGSRWQTMTLIEEIKRIAGGEGVSDKSKVGQLRKLLGLQQEEGYQSQTDLKDLLSDYKKKQEIIQID